LLMLMLPLLLPMMMLMLPLLLPMPLLQSMVLLLLLLLLLLLSDGGWRHGPGPTCKDLLWTRFRAHVRRLVVDTVSDTSEKKCRGRGFGSKCKDFLWTRFRAQV
jgi:hypothetical protein